MRHPRGLAFGVLVVAAVSAALGCGDEKPKPNQAVLWLGLSQAAGAQCSSASSFGVPDKATSRGIIYGNGDGDRLEDGGEDIVNCRVAETAAGQYDVQFEVSAGEIGNLSMSGTATKTSADPGQISLDINFQTTSFSLEQDVCTGSVQYASAGALWVRGLTCNNLRDQSSPGISCQSEGGFIIENCAD